jgi:cob(I)alamin adenosyltransferase
VRDEELVKEAWHVAKKFIKDESYKLIILDEINIATKLGYLSPEEIITFVKSLDNRKNHIVLTGRGASESIINQADLVTEMKLIRHPFKEQGIKAQACVEF